MPPTASWELAKRKAALDGALRTVGKCENKKGGGPLVLTALRLISDGIGSPSGA